MNFVGLFDNRKEAGLLLAPNLELYRRQDAVVVAIPRGGIPVGYAVANYLDLPLDVVLIKKIGHPQNKELAIGWVSMKDHMVTGEFEVSQQYIDQEVHRLKEEIKLKYQQYRGICAPVSLRGKKVILIDDGIATGTSVLAAAQLIRQSSPEKIIVAVPVAPESTIDKIAHYAEEVVCLKTPSNFQAVGNYYRNFNQVSDEEAVGLFELSQLRVPNP